MSEDGARRRELRRKKILENSEERKRKIMGLQSGSLIKDDNSAPSEKAVINNAKPAVSSTKPSSSVPFEESKDTSFIQSNSNSEGFSRSERKSVLTNTNKIYSYDHVLAPVILAFVVSICISILSYGHIFLHSYVVPFVLWEVHRLLSESNLYGTEHNLWVSLLMLSGINKDIVSSFTFLMSLILKITEDFALYFFTTTVFNIILEGLLQNQTNDLSYENSYSTDHDEDLDDL